MKAYYGHTVAYYGHTVGQACIETFKLIVTLFINLQCHDNKNVGRSRSYKVKTENKLVGARMTQVFSSPLARPMARSQPKCKTHCPGQTSIVLQNFNQIRSAVWQEMRPEPTETDRRTVNTIFPITLGEITRSSAVTETARRFVSLNILLSHSRSREMTLLSRACVSPY